MARKHNPGALARATGPGKPTHATAEGNRTISPKPRESTLYRITPDAGEPFRVTISGRTRWALDRLRVAGTRGCTPITEPAPRWSAYVHTLRVLGVDIETVTETHGGEFAGHHARYVLRCHANPEGKGGAT